jgi:ABC-type Fe3+ transport system permease subunit
MSIPWESLASIGPWGLVTLFVILIFFGFLVPGKQVKEWKDLYLRERESREDMQGLMGLLRKALDALPPLNREEE